MLRTYLYIPSATVKRIEHQAKKKKQSKAHILRSAIDTGLNALEQNSVESVDIMLQLAQIGNKHPVSGPSDLSSKHDKYLWGI